MRDAAGRSRCFAFLTFDDPASVNAVMVREHFLDGKIVRTLSYLALEFIYLILSRSIQKEPYLDKSINAPQNYSLVVSQAA
jgi:RNA-binding protein Musashi